MSRRDELFERLDELEQLPYHQQTDPVESVVVEADALDDDELGARAREVLLSALCMGDAESARMFAPFAWLVQRFDDRPSWWDDRHDYLVLWTYKWVINAALGTAGVPLPTITALIDGMDERYRRRDVGLAPVHMVRFMLTRDVEGHDAADDAFLAWVEAPRSRFSDCEACEPSAWVSHLAALGRHAQAVELFWPVHRGDLRCESQPQDIFADALPSLLETGHAEVAADVLLRGARLTRDEPGQASIDLRQMGTCARAGQLGRAVDLWDRRSLAMSQPESDSAALLAATQGAVLMSRLRSAGHGHLDVRTGLGTTAPVDVVHDDLVARATALAARFDERNGTPTASATLAAALAAPDLPPLDLPASSTYAVRGTPAAPAPAPAPQAGAPDDRPDDRPDELPDDLVALHRLALDAGERGDHRTYERVAERWERLLEARPGLAEPGDPAEPVDLADALVTLDLALCNRLFLLGRRDEVGPVVDRAARRCRAHGWVAQASSFEQRSRAFDLGPDTDEAERVRVLAVVRAAVDEVDAALAGVPPDGGDAVGPEWSPLRLRVRVRLAAASAGCEDAAALVAQAVDLTAATTATSSVRDRNLRAEVLQEQAMRVGYERYLADPTGALDHGPLVEAARAVLALLADGAAPDQRLQAMLTLSRAAVADGRSAESVELTGLALDIAEAGHGSEEAARCASHLADLAHEVDDDRLPAVLALLQRSLHLATARDDPAAAAVLRFDAAVVLRRLGRDVEAAESLELALREIDEADPDRPHYVSVLRTRGNVALAAADVALTLGEATHAARLAERAVDRYDAADEPVPAVRAAALAAQAHERVGDSLATLRAYRACGQRGEAVAAEHPEIVSTVTYAKRRLGELTLAVDGRPRAEAALDDAAAYLDTLAATTSDLHPAARAHVDGLVAWEHLSIRRSRAVVHLEDDEPAAALEVLDGLDREFGGRDDWGAAVDVVRLVGRAHAALGDRSAAEAAWLRAAREADLHDLDGMRVDVASTWATWLDREGDGDAADRVWDEWGPDR